MSTMPTEYQRKRLKALKDAGLCYSCHGPASGKTRCTACMRRHRLQMHNSRKFHAREVPAPSKRIERMMELVDKIGGAR